MLSSGTLFLYTLYIFNNIIIANSFNYRYYNFIFLVKTFLIGRQMDTICFYISN